MARAQAVEAIYDLRRAVAAREPRVVATLDGLARLLSPHLPGGNKEPRLGAFCYQFGESSGSGLGLGAEGIACGADAQCGDIPQQGQ